MMHTPERRAAGIACSMLLLVLLYATAAEAHGAAKAPRSTRRASDPIVFLRTGSVQLERPPDNNWDHGEGRRLLSMGSDMQDSRWGSLKGARQLLVSLRHPLKADTLQVLEGALRKYGGMLSSFLPEDTVLAVGSSEALEHAAAGADVSGVGEFLPEMKIAPEWEQVLRWMEGGYGSNATSPGAPELLTEGRIGQERGSGLLLGAVETDNGGADGGLRVLVEVSFPAEMFPSSSSSPTITLEQEPRTRQPRSGSGPEGRRGGSRMTRPLGTGAFEGRDLFSPAAAAALEWPETLSAALGGGPILLVEEDPLVLTAMVPAQALPTALRWLSEQPSVHWLAPRARQRLNNYQGITIAQTGRGAPEDASMAPGAEDGSFEELRPLWAAGLDGTGQIVGCGDSGIDVDSCFFHDPAVKFHATGTADRDGKFSFRSDTHRKIAYYRMFGDASDGSGHGTHVAASIAGSTDQDVWRKNNGMAPGARLAFTDVGKGSGGIGVPGNLARDYFPFGWSAGARVFSESWGSDSASYDGLARGVDKMSWENPEFLAVVAAGNFGGLEKDATINSPGTSKNSLTVGATLTAKRPNIKQVPVERDGDIFQLIVRGGLPGDGADNDAYNIQLAYFGPTFGSSLLGIPLGLEAADPPDACGALSNPEAIRGKVALVLRGGCDFVDKVRNAQQSGATAVFVANNATSGSFKMTFAGGRDSVSSIVIPSASMARNAARPMLRAMEAGLRLSVRLEAQRLPEDRWSNMAPFSSIGPTPDGRVKPDLVAPGLTISAGIAPGPGQCSRSVLHGTSMATPLVAGGAAIVRQYFVEGRYPTGRKTANHTSSPSGPLVKAILVAGAAAMSGTTPSDNDKFNGVPLESPPSIRQGFGRINVGVSLPLEGARWRLQVIDQAPIQTGETQTYCVSAVGGWLKVVLVWHDPPSDAAAAKNLVNNLDLSVRSAGLGGASILGNGDRDDVNNVEMVYLANVPEGKVAVTVAGVQVPQGPQRFSLVVLGQFTGSLHGEHNPVPASAYSPDDAVIGQQCVVNLAKVYIAPQELTDNRHPTFTFGAEEGMMGAGAGFECRLVEATELGGAKGEPDDQDWAACTSPMVFRDLRDGHYKFDVRVTGEDVSDSRSFVVDGTPPVVSFTAAPSPVAVDPGATFAFRASDRSPATFECRLRRTDGTSEAPPGLSGAIGALVKWESCSSPAEVGGLSTGQWEFSVRAIDAAGNAGDGISTRWRYDPDKTRVYTAFFSGPQGPTRIPEASFEFGLAREDYGSAISSAGFECLLERAAPNGATRNLYVILDWFPCSSPEELPSLSDGPYALTVRSASPKGRQDSASGTFPRTAARRLFSVDTQGASLSISSHPPALQTDSVATFEFSASEHGVETSCALFSGAGEELLQGPAPCTSPKTFLGLEDGSYTFTLGGFDDAGNPSAPQSFSWTVDASPPVLRALSAAGAGSDPEEVWLHEEEEGPLRVAISKHMVELSWEIDDGPDGTGVQSVFCTMTPIQVDGSESVPQWALGTGAAVASGTTELCQDRSRSYWLAEGNYTFQLSATDQAQNSASFDPVVVVVDMQPPLSVIRFGPDLGETVASTVLLRVEAADVGVAPSGVKELWGLLEAVTSDTKEAGTEAAAAAAVMTRTGGSGDAETAAAATVFLRGSASAEGVPAAETPVAVGTWSRLPIEGQLTSVIYRRLPAGSFSFSTRAVDAAGNSGPESKPLVFKVDTSLPVPNLDGTEPAPQYKGPLMRVEKAAADPPGVADTLKVAIPVSCAVVLLALLGFGVRRYQKHKDWGWSGNFLDLQAWSSRDWDDAESAHRGGTSSRRPQEEEQALKACDPSQRTDLNVGPWRLELDWAPITPVD